MAPLLFRQSLWATSGHLQNYHEDMFQVLPGMNRPAFTDETHQQWQAESFGLKPMNCPAHCLMFASRKRSYKDLPIRYADFSALHR